MPVMETIPNHVMMMTGVRPDRSGVPANEIFDRDLGEVRTMDRARDIRVRHRHRAAQQGRATAPGRCSARSTCTASSATGPPHRWEPAPIVPVSGHAPDVFTMDAALAMVDEFDPHLVFVNLGDIDRFGHATSPARRPRPRAALALAAHRPAGAAVRRRC